jgi:methylated-DNA-[protein]-cysteine S-methyltransferase
MTGRASLVFKTRSGWIGLQATARGVRAIVLPQPSRRAVERALVRLSFSLPLTPHSSPAALLRRAKRELAEFLDGKRRRVQFPLDLAAGTPFQRRVWQVAKTIPFGQARSYRWVAQRVGGVRYARAVGRALGANPVPIAVPCHRVLTQAGSLGGFSCGLAMKRRLLALEGVKKSESRKVKSPRR